MLNTTRALNCRQLLFALRLALLVSFLPAGVFSQIPSVTPTVVRSAVTVDGRPIVPPGNSDQAVYMLGPDDEIMFWSVELEEINNKALRIDAKGDIEAPFIGTLHAAGLTARQLEAAANSVLTRYMREPHVTVSVVNFNSQPVSVIGSVTTPGIYQLKGRKTLVDVLALAGGLKPDAGNYLTITRRSDHGVIPLPKATTDATGDFGTVDVDLNGLLRASDPQNNIVIQRDDIISVPRGKFIYVVGEVQRAGGFVLDEQHDSLTVLQAISLAGGLNTFAAPKRSKILRRTSSRGRTEIAVNLRHIVDGTSSDMALEADDVLFVPSNTSKKVSIRAIEALVQTASGVVIWHGL